MVYTQLLVYYFTICNGSVPRSVHAYMCSCVYDVKMCPAVDPGWLSLYIWPCVSHPPCVFMCVNALTTCPDGEAETFIDRAL